MSLAFMKTKKKDEVLKRTLADNRQLAWVFNGVPIKVLIYKKQIY